MKAKFPLRAITDSGVGIDVKSLIVPDDAVSVADNAVNLGGVYSPPAEIPELPASPDSDDIAEALVALGLVTQAAP